MWSTRLSREEMRILHVYSHPVWRSCSGAERYPRLRFLVAPCSGLSPALGRRGVAVCYSYISSPLRYGFQYTKASGIRFLIPEDTKVCRSVFILVELLKPRCALYSTMLVLLCADLLSSHSS